MTRLTLSVLVLAMPSAGRAGTMLCMGDNFCSCGPFNHVLIDEATRTVTAYDDTVMVGVRTPFCLVVTPGAHPKIVDSIFGKNCEPTS